MDTKLIEYILTIEKHRSISKAAEELYITQSALNQQLLKLEQELDAPLFIRSRNHWELTDIGKLYVENARQILHIKRDTYNQIQDMAKRWKGTVAVGLMPERGVQMFTAIYSQIHAMFPNTIFQPVEATVDTQVKMLENGRLDISFQTIKEHKYKHLVYKPILTESFYLCVPRTHELAYKEELPPEKYPEISLELFRNELFTLVRKSSNMRDIIDSLFRTAGFTPKLLFESSSMRTMQVLAASGECCSIIPGYYAVPHKQIAYFSLGSEACWEVTAVYRQNKYLNQAAREFINLASQYWQTHPHIE